MALGNRREVRLTVGADSRGYADLHGISNYLQCNPRTTRSYMKEHKFPYFKLPTGTIRFSYAEVDNWLAQFQSKSKAAEIAEKLLKDL